MSKPTEPSIVQSEKASSSKFQPVIQLETLNVNLNEDDGKASRKRQRNAQERKGLDLTYCEYNLSTMVDNKGGFIPESEEKNTNTDHEEGVADFPEEKKLKFDGDDMNEILANNLKCSECKSIDVDLKYKEHYNVIVCRSCRDKYPEKYSLLTKTEVRQDYLLTESELRDESRLPVWIRPNPHKESYSNMLLYLRMQVEVFAWDKWGSPEELDKEFEKREKLSKERKQKRYEAKMLELRKKTRTSIWKKKSEGPHKHEFAFLKSNDPGVTKQKCSTCGIIQELEDF